MEEQIRLGIRRMSFLEDLPKEMKESKSSYWQLESSSSLIIEFGKFVLWVGTVLSTL